MTDCQIAVLRGDNSDIILKKKNSYKTNGIEIYDRVEVRGEVIIVLIVPLWNWNKSDVVELVKR